MGPDSWKFLRERIIPSIRNAHDKLILEQAAGEYAKYETSLELNVALVAAIHCAVTSASQSVRASGAAWLWELARPHEEAGKLLLDWFDAGNAPVRLSMVQAIAYGWTPGREVAQVELEGAVLTRGLADRSAKVRAFSADRAEIRERTDLLSLMDAAVSLEQDPKTKRSLAHSRDMLRDGYICDSKDEMARKYLMWVKYRSATHQGKVGIDVPRDVVEEVGLAEVARRIRARKEQPGWYAGESWELLP